MHTIELYSGDSKRLNSSEEAVLKRVLDWLNDRGISAVIFTNFWLGNTQVDILLGMEGKTFQLEVKGHRGRIVGQQNGEWIRVDEKGVVTSHRNGFLQALSANQELLNHMQRIVGQDEKVAYPNGIVVFEGNIAHKSDIYHDSRVRMCDLDNLTEMLSRPISNRGGWPLSWMRIFAQTKGLIACPLPGKASHSNSAEIMSEPVRALPELPPRSTSSVASPIAAHTMASTPHRVITAKYDSFENHTASSRPWTPPKRKRRFVQRAAIGLILLAIAATLYKTPTKSADPLFSKPSPSSVKSAPPKTTDRHVGRTERKSSDTDLRADSNTSNNDRRIRNTISPALPATPISCPAGVDRLGCNGRVGVFPSPECPAGFHVSGDTCALEQR